MILKQLKNKTWIDWIKIVVAIDIAGSGIGLILGFNMHVFAHILGFLSRIAFGIMYVFVAMLIFKRVFPQPLSKEEHIESKKMNEEIIDTTNTIKKGAKKFTQKIVQIADQANEKIDSFLDNSARFAKKKKKEVKNEINELMKD